MKTKKQIKLNVGFGVLVAERSDPGDPEIPNELIIYLEDNEGTITQDIVLVRKSARERNVRHSRNIRSHYDGAVECLVWSDCHDEDYTQKFNIQKYTEV